MIGRLSSHTGKETFNTLFGGKIKVVQEKDGYRFSIDAVLLAGFVWLRRGERAIDLGTGVGIIPFILAKRKKGVEQIVGVEIQEGLTELAQRNVLINGLGELIHIVQGDIRHVDDEFPPATFDVVVTNPPYYRVSSGRINPYPQKAIARHEVTCTIDAVLQAARYLLKEGGRICIIFPAQRAVTLLDRLHNASLEPKTLRWVHSREGEEAVFILAEAYKGGGEGVKVLPPLYVYSSDGTYTPEMETIYADALIN